MNNENTDKAKEKELRAENTKQFRAFCRDAKLNAHKQIFSLLEYHVQFTIKPFDIRTDEYGEIAQKAKIIIATDTKQELDDLYKKINAIIDDCNKSMDERKAALNLNTSVAKISYKLKSIHSSTDRLRLSLTKAHQVLHKSGKAAVSWLKICAASASEGYKKDYEDALELFEKGSHGLVANETEYCIDKFSGSAYRVMYFGEDEFKHQTNVGDVLGVYGFDKLHVDIVPPTARKFRTNINKYIYANQSFGIRLDNDDNETQSFSAVFATNIKEARENAELTQQQVADALNTTRSNITKYELGTLEPNIDTIGRLAELYNVSLDFLFGLKDGSEE